ncbi:MAG: hypothetical protein A2521_16640 [Deltaproteobacteria bacterium RIFOXYD12_FULL_57_12]|nr:MAG: hypothetical protein A2521_16640 [Deltaproteobacteria bacterium RIFOXYD12_FULL_57_12]
MTGGRIFAIGDIHGCYDRMRNLLDRLPYDPATDFLVFLGDYIDRGHQARQVIDLLCRLMAESDRVIALLGNHEHLLLEYHRTADQALVPFLRQMGIEDFLEEYGSPNLNGLRDLSFLPPAHRQFFHALRPYWETDRYFFAHAGFVPGEPLAGQRTEDFCETRDLFLADSSDYGKRVIFGHTPFELPFVTPNKIGIDTGAAYGNLLTAVELPALKFYHA